MNEQNGKVIDPLETLLKELDEPHYVERDGHTYLHSDWLRVNKSEFYDLINRHINEKPTSIILYLFGEQLRLEERIKEHEMGF